MLRVCAIAARRMLSRSAAAAATDAHVSAAQAATTARLGMSPTIREAIAAATAAANWPGDDFPTGVLANTGAPVDIHGWVRSCRSQKNVTFADVTDGSMAQPLQVTVQGRRERD